MHHATVIVVICELRIEVELVCLTSHVCQWRLLVWSLVRTPKECIGCLCAQEVGVEPEVHTLYLRAIVCHAGCRSHSLVIAALLVSLVGEEVHCRCHIHVSDSSLMRYVNTVAHRITNTREQCLSQEWLHMICALLPESLVIPHIVLVLWRVVNAHVHVYSRRWVDAWTRCSHVYQSIESRRTVKHR